MIDVFTNCEGKDPIYVNLCEGSTPEAMAARQFIEELLPIYEPYADKNFCSSIRDAFFDKFWEMYLTCALILDTSESKGISVKPHKCEYGEKSPDLLLSSDRQRYWFEAVAPTQGAEENANSVPDIIVNKIGEGHSPKAQLVPEEAIILRLRSAIRNKVSQYCEHRQAGVIQSDDAYVIAINGSQIPFALYEESLPWIVKAVLPFGSPQVTIDVTTLETEKEEYTYRSEVKKVNGSSVGTDIFLCQDYSFISAVLYSNVNIPFCPINMDNLGDDFIIIHNPLALNSLPQDFIKRGREVVVTQQEFTYQIQIK